MTVLIVADGDAAATTALEAALRAAGIPCAVEQPDAAAATLDARVDDGTNAARTSHGDGDGTGTPDGAGVTNDALCVVAVGAAGAATVRAAADHGSIAGLALWACPLGDDEVELLSEWPDLAVLAVADPADRAGLAGAADAYLAASHSRADLVVEDLSNPERAEAVATAAAEWLGERLGSAVQHREVMVTTDDGWEIHGTLSLPTATDPVPGVVVLHTGRSDRAAFAPLAARLTDRGLAVLNLDWRGRGASINQGRYFDLAGDVKEAAWRDAMAALALLGDEPGVDENRLAAVGAVHGAEYAARAAWRDRRVRAVVALTGYRPVEPEEQPHLVSGEVSAMYVTCTDHTITTAAMRELHEATPAGRSVYVEYPGAAIGYQLFELDGDLADRVADWVNAEVRR